MKKQKICPRCGKHLNLWQKLLLRLGWFKRFNIRKLSKKKTLYQGGAI